MRHRPVLVEPPAEPPVTRDELKAHLRVDGSDDDATIDIYRDAAVAHLDGYGGILGQAIVTQTWRQNFDDFSARLRLPLPAASIASIKAQASDGTIATIAAENYMLQHDDLGSLVRFRDDYSAPTDLYQTKAIAVEFIAGFGAAPAVPASIKAAIFLLVGHWYANREAVNVGNITTALPFAVDALLAPHRRVGL